MIAGGRKTLKKYRGGNITATFGADLMLQGITSIPNLLLKYYTSMGITDKEMMLILQILRLRTEERILYPAPELLAEYLGGEISRVERNLTSLLEKEILTVTQYYDESQSCILSGYDFEPLYEKLSEVWACMKVKEIEKTRLLLEEQSNVKQVSNENFANLARNFEQEFGRPLSPMEAEQIKHWLEEVDYHIVLNALRRAVLLGKHNFKYIDTILLQWSKNNLRTIEAIEEYERRFQNKRARNPLPPARNGNKKGDTDEQKKAIIKTLYMN